MLEVLDRGVSHMKSWKMSLGVMGFVFFKMQVCGAMQFIPPQVILSLGWDSHQNVVLNVLNEEEEPLEVQISLGPFSQVRMRRQGVKLDAHEKKEIHWSGQELASSPVILHLQSEVLFLNRNLKVQGPFVFEILKKTEAGIVRYSYDETFLSRRRLIEDPDLQVGSGRFCSLPECMISAFSTHPVFAGVESMIRRGEMDEKKRAISPVEDPSSREQAIIRGHLSFKLRNLSYQAAEKVAVSVFALNEEGMVRIGSTEVRQDGSWMVSSSLNQVNQKIRVIYKAQNDFFTLNDPHHQVYTWSDEERVLQKDTDLGFRYIDLSLQGDLPGLDEVYLGAVQLWSKLSAQGLNILRQSPVEVVFPNSLATHSCILSGPQGPYPWSCSYATDGKIYLIPAHANRSVIQHELAHSIHSFFWKGQMPMGSGGAHNLWDCFHPGLALTEGFADFIAYWAQYGPETKNPRIEYFDLDIETLPEAVCSQAGSEMRVAATFWDLYDSQIDGPDAQTAVDQVLSLNLAAPISFFLTHPRNTMVEYLSVFQEGQSAQMKLKMKKLFRLNRMISSFGRD